MVCKTYYNGYEIRIFFLFCEIMKTHIYIRMMVLGLGMLFAFGASASFQFLDHPVGTFGEGDVIPFSYAPADARLQALFIRASDGTIIPVKLNAATYGNGKAMVQVPEDIEEMKGASLEVTTWDGKQFGSARSRPNIAFKNEHTDRKRSFLREWGRIGYGFARVGVVTALQPVYKHGDSIEFTWIPTNVWPDRVIVYTSDIDPTQQGFKEVTVFDYAQHIDWVEKAKKGDDDSARTYDVLPGKIRFETPVDFADNVLLVVRLEFDDPDNADNTRVFTSQQKFAIQARDEDDEVAVDFAELEMLTTPEIVHLEGSEKVFNRRQNALEPVVKQQDNTSAEDKKPVTGVRSTAYMTRMRMTQGQSSIRTRRVYSMPSRTKSDTDTPTTGKTITNTEVQSSTTPQKTPYRRASLYRRH